MSRISIEGNFRAAVADWVHMSEKYSLRKLLQPQAPWEGTQLLSIHRTANDCQQGGAKNSLRHARAKYEKNCKIVSIFTTEDKNDNANAIKIHCKMFIFHSQK